MLNFFMYSQISGSVHGVSYEMYFQICELICIYEMGSKGRK